MLLLGVLLCLSSCKSQSYEQAISDWIQTDSKGTWTDLKFELLEVIETKDITVSDSIQILEEKFKKKQVKNISVYTNKVNRERNSIALLEKSPYISRSRIENYRKTLKETEITLDSLRTLSFQSIYDNRKKEEVLVKLLKCRYSIFSPLLQTRQEKTETFILSSDLKKCVGRLKNTAK